MLSGLLSNLRNLTNECIWNPVSYVNLKMYTVIISSSTSVLWLVLKIPLNHNFSIPSLSTPFCTVSFQSTLFSISSPLFSKSVSKNFLFFPFLSFHFFFSAAPTDCFSEHKAEKPWSRLNKTNACPLW